MGESSRPVGQESPGAKMSAAKTEMALLETAAKWHFRRESGTMSDTDEARFEAWLHANRRHREAYNRVASTLMQVASSAQTSPMLLLRQQALRRARSCIAVRPRRSAERRVGKECVRTGSSRWLAYH